MGIYKYTARNLDGTTYRGTLQAEDEEAVYQKVRTAGYYVIRMKEIHKISSKRPLSPGQLAEFCEQLSAMLGSGLPLARAMGILITNSRQGYMTAVYQKIYEQLVRGSSFAEALGEQKGIFPPLFIGMFRAGEAGGQLDYSARRLGELYKKEDRLKKRIKTAMVYPAFLFLMTIASLVLIFTMIMPEFFELFESLDSLPESTRLMIWFSNCLTRYPLPIILSLAALILIVRYAARLAAARRFTDMLLLKLPVIGKMMKTICTAQFARTLGLLYANGLPLIQALEISAGVVGNLYVEAQFAPVIEAVRDGTGISTALKAVDGLEEGIITSLFIGEEAGELDVMLERAADNYEFEANEAATRLVSLAEPAVILLLAVIIGTIMLSVMLPIYQYYQTLGG